jgi:DNA-binding transcriptional ArsR family regulator
MNIKRALWGLAPILTLLFVIMESAMGGGGFFALETGRHLTHWWWEYVPAVGIGTIGPICATLVLYKVVSDQTMTRGLRRLLIAVFFYYTLGYITFISIYVIAHPTSLSFPKVLKEYGLDAWTPAIIWWLLSGTFLLPGSMLAAMDHDQRTLAKEEAKEQELERQKEARELLKEVGDAKAKVLEALSSGSMLTRQELALVTDLSYSQVSAAVKDLVETGHVETDGAAKNAKFWAAG